MNELLTRLHKKVSAAKYYLVCEKREVAFFLGLGFEEIKSWPEEVERVLEKNESGSEAAAKAALAYYPSKQKKADASFDTMPDLIVIDGGKGQLSAACRAAVDLGVKVNLCSLAKKFEDVYVPEKSDPVILPKDSPAQYLLQRLRDEAHRFAITHNRLRRDKKMLDS